VVRVREIVVVERINQGTQFAHIRHTAQCAPVVDAWRCREACATA
jgi:hypothetical protein